MQRVLALAGSNPVHFVSLCAILVGCASAADGARAGSAGPQTAYYGVAPPAGGVPPSSDVRLVGTGMVGPDVPHWPMFHHDSARTGRNGVARTAPPSLQWKYTTHGEIWSSPAIGIDGTVYIGSLDRRIYAIRE